MNLGYMNTDESNNSMKMPFSVRESSQSGMGDAFAFDPSELKKFNELATHSGN